MIFGAAQFFVGDEIFFQAAKFREDGAHELAGGLERRAAVDGE